MDTIGKRIRAARAACGKTQDAIARAIDVQIKTVARWETDQHAPRADDLDGLARELGVSIEWLVRGGRDHLEPEITGCIGAQPPRAAS